MEKTQRDDDDGYADDGDDTVRTSSRWVMTPHDDDDGDGDGDDDDGDDADTMWAPYV